MRPAVDIIVPFSGSDAHLDHLLARMRQLTLRPGDKLVIVDNRPGASVEQPRPGVVRAPDVQSSYHARNVGARSGEAPWLVFVDADVLPPPDLVDRYFLEDVDDRTAVLAGGIRDVAPDEGAAVAMRYARLPRSRNDENVWRPGFEYAQTGNAAVRRVAFDALGGFAEVRSGGDAELCFRMARAGWRIERRPGALVEHYSRASLRALMRQHLRYGAGTEWLEERYRGFAPRRSGPRVAVGVAREGIASARALARGDRDGAVRHGLNSACSMAFELGRRLPNEPGPMRAIAVAKLRQALRRPTVPASVTQPPGPLRLAIFCDRFPELSETFVAGEVRELRRRGIAVTVYARQQNRRDESWSDEVTVQPLEAQLRRRVRNALPAARMALTRPAAVARDLSDQRRWRREEHVAPLRRLAPLVERLARERTQHIHVHFAAEASLAALRVSHLTGIPFSITAHAYELFQRPANLREKFDDAAFVTVPCAYNVSELAKSGLSGARMHVRTLGTNTRVVRRTTPLPEDGLTLAVGRLIEKKGFQVLVEAAARRDLGPVWIIGEGPWRVRLEHLIATHGVQDRVTLAGASAHADITRWMERASMLVVPSVVAADGDQDALPVVLWEALAMELPVVGTTVGGIPEVVRPPWGRVVAPGDANALADAIVAWRATPYPERVHAGRAGRDWLERNHTQERSVQQLLELIEESERPPP